MHNLILIYWSYVAVITLWKRIWFYVHDKLNFFAPVLIVIVIAAFLVYCTYLANFTITAVVIEEEGTGTEAASAGLVNALTFILPAIIGGFGIALLFKYRKKITLKFFFGGALFFAGTFIIFFFGDSILYLVQTRFYGVFILNFDPYDVKLFRFTPLITYDGIYFLMIAGCCIVSFWITYIINSRRFERKTKNSALLIQSALMGAFLSVILPTYTVVILLIGLSIYDIYSVRRGPIKDIVRYTLEDEAEYFNSPKNHKKLSAFSSVHSRVHNYLCNIMSIKISLDDAPSSKNSNIDTNQRFNKDIDETDTLLTSMTYSSKDWDIGIGDLVFYSMLASQPLTPYFIFNHGSQLLEYFGLWIFWLICLCTVIGILIGFFITIRLLERNSMLPGLPISIALGLSGFLGSTFILYLF